MNKPFSSETILMASVSVWSIVKSVVADVRKKQKTKKPATRPVGLSTDAGVSVPGVNRTGLQIAR
jgi:hypothetical protein